MILSAEYGIAAGVDHGIRFAIPNEKEIRQANNNAKASRLNKGTRTIAFIGDGAEPTFPSDLPFKPLGLQWKGTPSITRRQLNEHREGMVGRLKNTFISDSATTI